MANKIIDLTGDAIETALQLVDTSTSVDQAPTAGSSFLCTSGTLYTYIDAAIDGSLNNGPKITADTFNATTLVNQTDTLAGNISNAKVATTAAIRDYVQAQPRATVSNIAYDGGNTPATVTNLDGNVTINTSVSNERLTINLIANENAHYLLLGTTQNPGLTTPANVHFDFYNAANLDVLMNTTGLVGANLTIIRFV